MSDHSSHFDSVLGTAINLGIHSVNEKGSLTHPKVSVLAREAKELQGVRSPPSPSPVPPAQAPAAAAPKKDEGKGISPLWQTSFLRLPLDYIFTDKYTARYCF